MTRTEALHTIATETGTLSPRELALECRRLTGARSIIIDFDPDTFAGLVARAKREGAYWRAST